MCISIYTDLYRYTCLHVYIGNTMCVYLADHGDEDVEVDAAEVAHLVGVEAAGLGPHAHDPEHGQEGGLVVCYLQL